MDPILLLTVTGPMSVEDLHQRLLAALDTAGLAPTTPIRLRVKFAQVQILTVPSEPKVCPICRDRVTEGQPAMNDTYHQACIDSRLPELP